MSLVRESALSNIWPTLYLTFIMIALAGLSTNWIIIYLLPIVAVAQNTKWYCFYRNVESGTMQLSLVDALVMHSIAFTISRSTLLYTLFNLLGSLTSLPLRLFLKPFSLRALSYFLSAFAFLLALALRLHIILVLSLFLMFWSTSIIKIRPRKFRLVLACLLLELDKIIVDVWRIKELYLRGDIGYFI